MAFWVTVQDSNSGDKTLVSYATSEPVARAEAENKGLVVQEIVRVSSDVDATELEKYERLTLPTVVRFQIFCLTAGQVASVLACIGCVPLVLSTAFSGGPQANANAGEAIFMLLTVGVLTFCTCAAMYVVFSYVKQQLKS